MKVDLSSLLCYRLFFVVRANEQLVDKYMKPLGLNRTQWKVIARFNFLSAPWTQQQLLASMGIDRGHLTRTLEQLELRCLITRERTPSDKRSFHIVLTTAGKKLLKKIEHILQLESERMINGLNQSEQFTLKKLIGKIESNILLELEDNP